MVSLWLPTSVTCGNVTTTHASEAAEDEQTEAEGVRLSLLRKELQ